MHPNLNRRRGNALTAMFGIVACLVVGFLAAQVSVATFSKSEKALCVNLHYFGELTPSLDLANGDRRSHLSAITRYRWLPAVTLSRVTLSGFAKGALRTDRASFVFSCSPMHCYGHS